MYTNAFITVSISSFFNGVVYCYLVALSIRVKISLFPASEEGWIVPLDIATLLNEYQYNCHLLIGTFDSPFKTLLCHTSQDLTKCTSPVIPGSPELISNFAHSLSLSLVTQLAGNHVPIASLHEAFLSKVKSLWKFVVIQCFLQRLSSIDSALPFNYDER